MDWQATEKDLRAKSVVVFTLQGYSINILAEMKGNPPKTLSTL